MNPQDIVILTPRGRLDAASARPLEAELKQHLADGRVRVIVDLKDTRYIGSNGLRVLLAALKQAKARGGAVKLCCLSPRLIEILEMVGLDCVFEIFATRAEAEASMRRQSERG
jgi:anti-anti-sigma factor